MCTWCMSCTLRSWATKMAICDVLFAACAFAVRSCSSSTIAAPTGDHCSRLAQLGRHTLVQHRCCHQTDGNLHSCAMITEARMASDIIAQPFRAPVQPSTVISKRHVKCVVVCLEVRKICRSTSSGLSQTRPLSSSLHVHIAANFSGASVRLHSTQPCQNVLTRHTRTRRIQATLITLIVSVLVER